MGRNITSMNIVLGVVNTGLYKGLKMASGRLSKFATKMKTIGASMTMAFTVPFALVAGASVKMAMDFERSMTKIQTLVLGTAQDMDKYAEAVMHISSITAVSAQESAEGLYFLTSAGLRGANALDTLMTVNKGVALGLGESTDLAKVAAAAQNAYGAETITATEAIDAFGMAVRTGMFESSELAESLGTQVGMAAELGISFQELLANISTYTKTTGDARSATTGFGGVMMAFAKETSKGRDALSQVNMSYEGLRSMLQDRGLAETLFTMKDAFAANGVQMTEFFGKSQAVKNIMGVLGEQGENYIKILDDMGDSADFTADAFDVLSQTPAFKIEKSINNIKLNFQKLGGIIMPVISALVQGLSNAIQWFDNLSGATKGWILAIAGVAAMIGPLISFFGFLSGVISFLISPIGLVIVALSVLGVAIYKNWNTVKKWIVAIVNYFIDLYNESMGFRGIIQGLMFVVKTLFEYFKMYFGSIYDVIVAFAKSAGDILGGIGQMIKGIFTLSWSDIKAGFKKTTDAFGKSFSNAIEKVSKRAKTFGDNTAKNWNTAVENTLSKEKIEFITEEDIQRGVDAMADWAKAGIEKVKAMFKSEDSEMDFDELFGDVPTVVVPTQTTTTTTDGGDPDSTDSTDAMDRQKSAIRTHLEEMGGMWTSYFAKQDEDWTNWGQKTQAITMEALDFIGGLLDNMDMIAEQRHKNSMIQAENEYKQDIENLEAQGLSEEEFNDAKIDLDKDYATKKGELEKKAAKREKKMALFNAIINTAAGIAKAIPNIPMMILAGVIGGMQIAAIKAQPIPMATGALAFSPTNALVGDNVNARNDPEIIAPLSKLQQYLSNQGSSVRVVGSISGNEIVLSSDKAHIGLARYA